MITSRGSVESDDLVGLSPWPGAFPGIAPMARLLENVWPENGAGDEYAPAGDLEETDDAFVLELDLPGVARDNVRVDATGRRVAVQGRRMEKERTGMVWHSTRPAGTFAFEVILPMPVDDSAVTATLVDGVLTVRIPKPGAAKTARVAVD